MKFSVLGTGMVGDALATRLITLGHEVRLGSRTATNERALAWHKRMEQANPGKASVGTFADAASFGDMSFCALNGEHAVETLKAIATELGSKVLVDTTNPLDFSKGMPPLLSVANEDSLGEQIQRALPRVKVVKALNTVTAALMVEPQKLKDGDHTLFVCGDDADAKGQVKEILTTWFGWRDVLDLGPIAQSRGMEMYLTLWLRLYGVLKTPGFNVKVVR